ncbi:hypothetical protein LIER_07405 [Lithospermum erythrorhizon]|uniref:CCHC-type domain-containing protein n=1 Tax=Lithospermum erythrorhizon TaxID=34254 RepID=A0AAV3P866_LITER
MLNNIYHTIMNWIDEERHKKLRRKSVICERIDEVLRKREEKIFDFITRPSRSLRYAVTSAKHSFVVDIEKRQCSCGLWQLGGLPWRPKRCRQKDASERAEAAAKIAAEKEAKKNDGVFRASRKGSVIHCKICGALGHNARSCPRRSLSSIASERGSQPATSSRKNKGKATISTFQLVPCTTTGDGGSQAATTQRKKRKT